MPQCVSMLQPHPSHNVWTVSAAQLVLWPINGAKKAFCHYKYDAVKHEEWLLNEILY